ncbi:MAG: hypothetical protein N2200_02630 [Bacteroidia bacterium]|nr:hypothetical protein [Bacteroidia bacterium]
MKRTLQVIHLIAGLLFSQTISSVQPTLTVCGEAGSFSVTITNNTALALSSPELHIQLPPGISYQPGSVSPATVSELTISPANAPKFGLPTIPAQSSFTITFSASASCALLSILDNQNGQLNNTYTLTWGGGTQTINYTTPNYTALRPALSYLSITNKSYLTPTAPAVFSRTFTVKNAGNGRLSSFWHRETAGSGIAITGATGGTIQTHTPNFLELAFSGVHFTSIGNGDAFFDPNESITFTVSYQINTCSNLNSVFQVGWGCGGDTCVVEIETGGVAVTANGLVPNVVTPAFPPSGNAMVILNESSCYGDAPGNASRILFRAVNNGTGPAYDLEVILYVLPLPPFSAAANPPSRIDTGSLTVRIGAGGPILPRQIIAAEAGPANSCFTVPNVVRRCTLRVPQPLAAGDTLYIEFDQYVCQPSCSPGNTTLRQFGWALSYRSGCNDTYTSPHGSSLLRNRIGANLINSHPGAVTDGQTFNLCITVDGGPGNYWHITPDVQNINGAPSSTNYVYQWEIQLPPGVVYTGAPLQWVGVLPSTFIHWNAASAVQTGTTLRVNFTHPNRPAGWSYDAFQNSYLCIPLTFTCGTPGSYSITSRLFYNPNPSCNPTPGYCYGMPRTTQIALNCPTACPNGMEFIGFSLRRTSYGLPDNDNDGLPDGSGTLDFTKIRTDRFMVTDTGVAHFRGVIRTSGAPWQYAWAHMELRTQGDRFSPVNAQIRIRKFSGIVYQGTVPVINDPACGGPPHCNRFAVNMSVSALSSAGVVPGGFVWENGDSVEVWIRITVAVNPGNIRQQVEVVPLLYTTSSSAGLGSQAAPHSAANRFACGEWTDAVEIIGYTFSSGDALVSANGCPSPYPQVTYHYHLYMGNAGDCTGNLFPYEYRQWSIPTEFRVTLPTGWRYVIGTGQLTHDRTQGNPTNTSITCLAQQTAVGAVEPINPNASTLIFQTSGAFTSGGGPLSPSDDGFKGVLRFRVRPTCATAIETEEYVPVRITFSGRISSVINARPLPNGYRLRFNGPRLSVEGVINPVVAPQQTVEWYVKVSNTSNVSSAPNAFLFFTAPNGGLSVTQVIDAATNLSITPTGGYYPIGNILAGQDRYFYVRALVTSCPDTLIARVGWDCQGYPNPLSTYPCLNSAPNARLAFIPANPLILSSATISPSPSELCDTLTVEVELNNGGTGHAYLPTFYFILPPGTSYVPNSGQAQYPLSAAWSSIPDPATFLVLRYWNLAAFIPGLSNGLPHTGNDKIRLRFRIATSCSFVSGAQLRFFTLYRTICGEPRYQISNSPLIALTNVVTPYETTISAPDVTVNSCGGTYLLTVTIVNRGPASTGADDSVRVVIPSGIYVSNSTNGLINFTAHEPVISTAGGNTILTWGINPGVPMGDTIRFSFQFQVASTLPHGLYNIALQSVINANRACGTTTCNIFYPTGSGNSVLDVQRPVGLWRGEVSSDWFNPSNWGDCEIPTCAKDVTIQPGTPFQPVIAGAAACRHITILSNALLTLTNTGSINICGDYWLQPNAILNAQTGSQMRFVGSVDQRYKKEGAGDPYNLEMAQTLPNRRLILQTPLTIEGNLTLTMGVIDGYLQGHETFVKRAAANAVSIGNTNSYVSGLLRRNLNTSARDNWYYLPVGHLPSGKGYQRGEILFDQAPAFGQLLAYFLPWPTLPPPYPVTQVDCGAPFGTLPNLDNGYWVIERIGGLPTSYHIRLYARNYTNATGSGYAVVKRPLGSPLLFGFEGMCEGSPYDQAHQTGRLQVPDFSEFAIAQSPRPLTTQFIYVRGVARDRYAELNYAIRQDWATADYHEIQRSVDGHTWHTVTIYQAQSYLDKRGDIGEYGWKDYDVQPNTRYLYRIIVRERSGSAYYSDVVEVLMGSPRELRASIVPNPSRDEAWLELSEPGYPVRILTITGTLLWEGYAAEEKFQLPVESLSAGVYIVEVGSLRLRWVKQ